MSWKRKTAKDIKDLGGLFYWLNEHEILYTCFCYELRNEFRVDMKSNRNRLEKISIYYDMENKTFHGRIWSGKNTVKMDSCDIVEICNNVLEVSKTRKTA